MKFPPTHLRAKNTIGRPEQTPKAVYISTWNNKIAFLQIWEMTAHDSQLRNKYYKKCYSKEMKPIYDWMLKELERIYNSKIAYCSEGSLKEQR